MGRSKYGNLASVDTRICEAVNPKIALPIYVSRLKNEASHKCIIGVDRRTVIYERPGVLILSITMRNLNICLLRYDSR